MILYDFSSLLHRSLHTSIKHMRPHKRDGLYITSEFIGFTIHLVIKEMIEVYTKYGGEYGELVICLDDYTKKYWRKEVYPDYKGQRKSETDASEIDYNEVFSHLNKLVVALDQFTPFRCFSVPGAEADDIIAVLSKIYAPTEKILIHSPDKDMVQVHKYGPNVVQWSGLTNKWITESEYKDPNYHICLGDSTDNIPKITDEVYFSENFKKYLKKNNINITEYDYYLLEDKADIIGDYSIYKVNRKGVATNLDIYDNPRFGKTTLAKKIKEFGSLDNYLDSNPLLRAHYKRNQILVIADYIPENIVNLIKEAYKNSSTEFYIDKLVDFLSVYDCNAAIIEFKNLAREFAKPVELTVDNWEF